MLSKNKPFQNPGPNNVCHAAAFLPKVLRQFLQLAFVKAILCMVAYGAFVRDEWKHSQTFILMETGLVKVSIPLETLTALRAGMEDLRLIGPNGKEFSCAIQKPSPRQPPAQSIYEALNFQARLMPPYTILTFAADEERPAKGIWVETPETEFVKAASLQGSNDGQKWELIARGLPLFRHALGQRSDIIPVPNGNWKYFRIAIDDQRSKPIPFTSARIYSLNERQPSELFPVTILQRADEPRQTKLLLQFAGANVTLAALEIAVKDPFFRRTVVLYDETFANNQVLRIATLRDTMLRELAQRTNLIERLQPFAGAFIRAPSVLVSIENNDSQPLSISGLSAKRFPVYLIFFAPERGTFELFSGNDHCSAPEYDMAQIGVANNAKIASVTLGKLLLNPTYQSVDPLSAAATLGAPLETTDWKYRKPVLIATSAVQQLEINLEVLAHSAPSLDDLRLVRQGFQMPFVLDRSYVLRSIKPTVAKTDDPKRLQVSRWKVSLPNSGIPVSSLTCTTAAPFFRRTVRIVAEHRNEVGETQSMALTSAEWTKELDQSAAKLTLNFSLPRGRDEFYLEVENGDNAPLEIQQVELWYPASRMLFKAAPESGSYLYYGNDHSSAPQYDLQLLGPRLLQALKVSVFLGTEEVLKAIPAKSAVQNATWVFWAILVLVVVGLSVLVARLLPAEKT